MTDPIADMLTRLRNAVIAKHAAHLSEDRDRLGYIGVRTLLQPNLLRLVRMVVGQI